MVSTPFACLNPPANLTTHVHGGSQCPKLRAQHLAPPRLLPVTPAPCVSYTHVPRAGAHLDGRQARRQPQPLVVPVRHDDAPHHAGGHAPRRLVHVLALGVPGKGDGKLQAGGRGKGGSG